MDKQLQARNSTSTLKTYNSSHAISHFPMSSASVARPHRDLWSPNGHSAFGEPESTTNPPSSKMMGDQGVTQDYRLEHKKPLLSYRPVRLGLQFLQGSNPRSGTQGSMKAIFYPDIINYLG